MRKLEHRAQSTEHRRFYFYYLYSVFCILGSVFISCDREIREEVLLNNYAIYCIKNNLWDEARFYLERARELSPEKASINNNLGVVYEYLGRKEDAILSYKKAIGLEKEEIYYKNLSSCTSIPLPKGLKNNISGELIRIEKSIPSAIDISKIDRLGLLIYAEDKDIIPYILSSVKEQILEEAPFYIVYQEGTSSETPSEIKNINLKLLSDLLLIVKVLSYNCLDTKDFDVSTKFIKDENRYEFLRTYYTDRRASLSFSLSLFSQDGDLLFKKDFKGDGKKRYDKENPPIYDYSLILSLTKGGISHFLSLMKPRNYVIERWLVKD